MKITKLNLNIDNYTIFIFILIVVIILLMLFYNFKIINIQEKYDKLKKELKHKRYIRHKKRTKK